MYNIFPHFLTKFIKSKNKKVENHGIDPCASRMLSERSTI